MAQSIECLGVGKDNASDEDGVYIYLRVLGKPLLQETLKLSLCEPVSRTIFGSLAHVLLCFGETFRDATSIESFELLRFRCCIILVEVLLLYMHTEILRPTIPISSCETVAFIICK